MTTDPGLPVQKAVYARLTAPAVLPPIGGAKLAVRDRALAGDEPPYLVIGDDDILDAGVGEYVTANVHCWSRQVGRTEVKTMAGAVRVAIDPDDDGSTPLDASAWGVRIGFARWQSTRILDDPDGVTKHAIVTFKVGTNSLV